MKFLPNIEIHGYDSEEEETIAATVFCIIKGKFSDELEDTVITFIPSRVVDYLGNKRPYLRVLHTTNKKAEIMAQAFAEYFEVEVLPLSNFFPLEESI